MWPPAQHVDARFRLAGGLALVMYVKGKNSSDLAFKLIFDRSKFLETLSDGDRDIIFCTFFNFESHHWGHARVNGHVVGFRWVIEGRQCRICVWSPWDYEANMFYMQRVNMSPSLGTTRNHLYPDFVEYHKPSPPMNDGVCASPRHLQVQVENQNSRLNGELFGVPARLV